jgi:hypothetical protein
VKQARVRVAKLLLADPVDNPVKVARATNPVRVISLGLVVVSLEKKKKITPESVMTVSSMTIATGSRTKTRLLKKSPVSGLRKPLKRQWRKVLRMALVLALRG